MSSENQGPSPTGDDVGHSLGELNARFYRTYPRNYFRNALDLALAGLTDPKQALSPLSEPQHIPSTPGAGFLEVQVTTEDLDETDFGNSVKLQIANLYHHSLETLLRLFFAHRPGVRCPWVEMAREHSIPKFKQRVEKVRSIDADWKGQRPEDTTFQYVFLPKRDLTTDDSARLTAAKQWIKLAAAATQDVPTYNSFKHGLALNAGKTMAGVYPSSTSGRNHDSIQPIVHADGDAISILRREKEADGSYAWFEETQWFNVAERAATIWVAQQYIQAILAVGAVRFAAQELKPYPLPDYPPQVALGHFIKDIGIERLTLSLPFVELRSTERSNGS